MHGKSQRNSYAKVPATIFGSPVTFLDVVDLELGGPDIQFLLGTNFLRGFVTQFDYTNERMRLITRDSVDLKAIKNIDTKKDRKHGSLVVKVKLSEDDNVWLLMDTGSTGGLLVKRSLAKRMDWYDTLERQKGESSGVISSGEMERFRVPSIEVGPFKVKNVLVSIPAQGESLELFESITPIGSKFKRRNTAAGILGFDVLKHFVVTIDFDRGHVHFYPGEKVSEE